MFVLFTHRVVKVNTGSKEKFAPRSSNQTRLTVSGPFLTAKAAQRAALTALGIHTCIDAQVWSESQVREEHAKGYSRNGEVKQKALEEAVRILDAIKCPHNWLGGYCDLCGAIQQSV